MFCEPTLIIQVVDCNEYIKFKKDMNILKGIIATRNHVFFLYLYIYFISLALLHYMQSKG